MYVNHLNATSRYVDIILNLIRIAGDYVSEEVWYRVIQIVINRDDVQGKKTSKFLSLIVCITCFFPEKVMVVISMPFSTRLRRQDGV